MKGKKVANWLGGNEFELFAALTKNGIDPHNSSDVTIVQQPFDMNLFLQKQVDSASAMTYNELAQVLESKNPDTGKLYTLDRPQRAEDAERRHGDARGRHLLDRLLAQGQDEPGHRRAFLKASFQGWIYCRDHWRQCVNITLQAGPTLAARVTRPGR